jgi:hypothetical protein
VASDRADRAQLNMDAHIGAFLLARIDEAEKAARICKDEMTLIHAWIALHEMTDPPASIRRGHSSTPSNMTLPVSSLSVPRNGGSSSYMRSSPMATTRAAGSGVAAAETASLATRCGCSPCLTTNIPATRRAGGCKSSAHLGERGWAVLCLTRPAGNKPPRLREMDLSQSAAIVSLPTGPWCRTTSWPGPQCTVSGL